MPPRTTITVKLIRQGWHSWPSATGVRAYLRDLHRHSFHVTATVAVRHDNRDVEFHDLQQIVRAWWGNEEDQTDRGSCEHIATELHEYLRRLMPDRPIAVTVGEDGEAYASVNN